MKRLFDFEFPPRRVLFILTLVCLILMAGTYFRSDSAVPIRTAVGYIIVPLQTGMNKAGEAISKLVDQRISMNQLLDNNAELLQQNELLRQELALSEKDKSDLLELQRLLDMKEKYTEYDMTAATIISKNSENWYKKFTINKGTNDGIAVNMVVVSGKGLVGIVSAVGATYATVTSIIDDTMNVSAMSVATKANCIIKGDAASLNEGLLTIKYLDKDDTINPGDTIITSNISDYYLPGFVIGYAKEITMDTNMLTQSGYLVPAVDFTALEDVLVVTTLKNKGN